MPPCRLPSRLALAGVATLLAAGCAMPRLMTSYPTVDGGAALASPVVEAGGDTLWVTRIGPVTLVSAHRAALDVDRALIDGMARYHARLLGRPPAPVVVGLLPAPRRGRPWPTQPVLPDSLARGVVWGGWVEEDTLGTPAGEVPDPERAFAPQWLVAQRWVDDELALRGPFPAWLQAGVVSLLANGPDRWPRSVTDAGLRAAPPLDTLLARRCPDGWRPVPGDPEPSSFDLRYGPRDPTPLAWRPWLADRCGRRLRVHAASLLGYLVETAGEPVVADLLADARAGKPFELTLRRHASALPDDIGRLDAAWRRWAR